MDGIKIKIVAIKSHHCDTQVLSDAITTTAFDRSIRPGQA